MLTAAGSGFRAVHLLLLGIVLIIGTHLRVGAVVDTVVQAPIRADAAQYVAYAYNLRVHETYSHSLDVLLGKDNRPKPDALRTPGYPLFLYLFTTTGDLEQFSRRVTLAQAGISSLTILLAYGVAAWVLGPSWAIGVALLTALSPHLVTANTYLLSETLFTFLLMLGLLAAQRAAHGLGGRLWIVVGLLLGLATLVRPTLQYFFLVASVVVALQPGARQGIRAAAWLVLGFAVVVVPWMLRNWLAIGAVGDGTLMISTLHHGMYPQFMYGGRPETFGFPYRFDPDAARIAESVGSVLQAIAARFRDAFWEHLSWYAEKPLWFLRWGIVAGQGDVFVYPTEASPYYGQPLFVWTRTAMYLTHSLLVGLSFLGAVTAWLPVTRRLVDDGPLFSLRLLAAAYLYFIVIHIVGAPFPRYSIPVRPLTYALALVPLYLMLGAWPSFRRSRSSRNVLDAPTTSGSESIR
jgi:4-amino-4-deoxy-L-arabinose transferase-like glycosyltransferase